MVSCVGQKLPEAPNSNLNPLTMALGWKRSRKSDSSIEPNNGNLLNAAEVFVTNFLYSDEIFDVDDGAFGAGSGSAGSMIAFKTSSSSSEMFEYSEMDDRSDMWRERRFKNELVPRGTLGDSCNNVGG